MLHEIHPEIVRQMMAAAAGHNLDAPANIGKAGPMTTQVVPGGVLLQDTQLISMRVNHPRQWVVTLMQPVRPGAVQPWAQDFDAGAYSPPTIPPPSVFGAPAVNASSLSQFTSQLRVKLRWGAGGVTFYTQADWPMMGGTFGVVADSFDLDAVVTVPGGVLQPMPAQLVPQIGAFMVPGVATDPTPLRWLDKIGGAPAGVPAGQGLQWSVKPYAKKLRVITGGAKVGVSWQTLNDNGIIFVLAGSTLVESAAGAGIDALVDIPAGAEIVKVFNDDAAARTLQLEWWMGLV